MTTVTRLRSDESLAAEGINLKALQSISGTVMIPGRADSVERIHLTNPYGSAAGERPRFPEVRSKRSFESIKHGVAIP